MSNTGIWSCQSEFAERRAARTHRSLALPNAGLQVNSMHYLHFPSSKDDALPSTSGPAKSNHSTSSRNGFLASPGIVLPATWVLSSPSYGPYCALRVSISVWSPPTQLMSQYDRCGLAKDVNSLHAHRHLCAIAYAAARCAYCGLTSASIAANAAEINAAAQLPE